MLVESSVLAFLGGQELLIVLAIALLLFGATRLPKLARSLGSSVTEFKKGVSEAKDALPTSDESDPT